MIFHCIDALASSACSCKPQKVLPAGSAIWASNYLERNALARAKFAGHAREVQNSRLITKLGFSEYFVNIFEFFVAMTIIN